MRNGFIMIRLFCLVLVLSFLWSFGDASRVSEACIEWNACTGTVLDNQPYCVSADVDYTNCIWGWLTNSWSVKSSDIDSVKTIIEKYCKMLLWLDKAQWRIYYAKLMQGYDWWDWQQTFDSNQSLFVYAFCSSFERDWDRPFLSGTSALMSGAFQWEDIVKILKLEQLTENGDNCHLSDDTKSLNNCDMSLYATEIFSSIMSEIFKIWYAQIFNVNTVKDFDSKKTEKVISFMSWYYGIGGDYEKVSNRFPQTVNILKSDQLFYKKVLDKLKLINNSELASLAEDEGACSKTWDVRWLQYLACALHGSQGDGVALSKSFITMCYNEVLNYRVFLSYYTSMLDKMSKNADNWIFTFNDTQRLIFDSQILDLKNYSNMQLAAFKDTLSSMEDLSMTYPLHIWLLMYQERLKNFRNRYLSPVVTMFYSLSEKLQNVQLPPE